MWVFYTVFGACNWGVTVLDDGVYFFLNLRLFYMRLVVFLLEATNNAVEGFKLSSSMWSDSGLKDKLVIAPSGPFLCQCTRNTNWILYHFVQHEPNLNILIWKISDEPWISFVWNNCERPINRICTKPSSPCTGSGHAAEMSFLLKTSKIRSMERVSAKCCYIHRFRSIWRAIWMTLN